MRLLRLWLAAAALAGSAAAAQSPTLVPGAIAAGQVGERYDGYMGFAVPPSEAVKRQVDAINLRRRNLYIELAGRRNVTAQVVGMATGCELLANLAPGEAY
ncbi:MAG TPA: DUF1318 domain-containing protein, partial [Sphingomicrobium sp.]